MKEISDTFCLRKLKAIEKAHFSKSLGGWWIFFGEFMSLLWKLMFPHSPSCWSHSHGVVKPKTGDYHQKLNVQVVSRIAKQFRTNDLRKWGTFKAVYASYHLFNDAWIWTRNSWIWTCTFEFQLMLSSFQLVTSNS